MGLRTGNRQLHNVFIYKAYRMMSKVRSTNGKKAGHMGENFKQMKTLIKRKNFDDKDSIKIIQFLARPKPACDSNRLK